MDPHNAYHAPRQEGANPYTSSSHQEGGNPAYRDSGLASIVSGVAGSSQNEYYAMAAQSPGHSWEPDYRKENEGGFTQNSYTGGMQSPQSWGEITYAAQSSSPASGGNAYASNVPSWSTTAQGGLEEAILGPQGQTRSQTQNQQVRSSRMEEHIAHSSQGKSLNECPYCPSTTFIIGILEGTSSNT